MGSPEDDWTTADEWRQRATDAETELDDRQQLLRRLSTMEGVAVTRFPPRRGRGIEFMIEFVELADQES